MGSGQGLGFSAPPIPRSRRSPGAGCLPPFLRLSVHHVILELLQFPARLVALHVFWGAKETVDTVAQKNAQSSKRSRPVSGGMQHGFLGGEPRVPSA